MMGLAVGWVLRITGMHFLLHGRADTDAHHLCSAHHLKVSRALKSEPLIKIIALIEGNERIFVLPLLNRSFADLLTVTRSHYF